MEGQILVMSSTLIHPPIIVSEGGDVDVFESIEDAEKYLEPIDVKAGRFKAFDCEGRSLLLHPTTPRVSIDAEEETPTHEEELTLLLRRFLRQVGTTDAQLESASLAELVEKSVPYRVH